MATLLEVKADVVRLHPDDNVVVAAGRIAKGTKVVGEGITARDTIPTGHKVATRAISAGETVRKYGQVIGAATADIAPGQRGAIRLATLEPVGDLDDAGEAEYGLECLSRRLQC